jgi:hypothetical protein
MFNDFRVPCFGICHPNIASGEAVVSLSAHPISDQIVRAAKAAGY